MWRLSARQPAGKQGYTVSLIPYFSPTDLGFISVEGRV